VRLHSELEALSTRLEAAEKALGEAMVKLEAHEKPPTNLLKRIDAALSAKGAK